jgi:PilZ domain
MRKERRTDFRVPLNLPARYDGLSGAHEAKIEDISLGGCFVNTRGQVDPGEAITVEVKLPSGEWLQLKGAVTTYQPGIGFGIIFSNVTTEQEHTLQQLIIG